MTWRLDWCPNPSNRQGAQNTECYDTEAQADAALNRLVDLDPRHKWSAIVWYQSDEVPGRPRPPQTAADRARQSWATRLFGRPA